MYEYKTEILTLNNNTSELTEAMNDFSKDNWNIFSLFEIIPSNTKGKYQFQLTMKRIISNIL